MYVQSTVLSTNRDPAQCYDKKQWESFTNITAEIITTFTKKKLDTRASKKVRKY